MVTYRIPDMTCGRCAGTIARAIADVDKDARIEISIPDKLVRVASAAPASELSEAIREAGYTPQEAPEAARARPAATGGCCCASRKAAAVDVGQAAAGTADPCCG